MKQKESFFSLAELKQPVNQWICVAFLCVLCFWVVLYYFTQETQAIGAGFAAAVELPAGDIGHDASATTSSDR